MQPFSQLNGLPGDAREFLDNQHTGLLAIPFAQHPMSKAAVSKSKFLKSGNLLHALASMMVMMLMGIILAAFHRQTDA